MGKKKLLTTTDENDDWFNLSRQMDTFQKTKNYNIIKTDSWIEL